MTKNRFRQFLLCAVAAVFLLEAGVALLNPGAAAARVGYEISGPDGLSEYRAVYLGMFGVLGIAMLFAAWNVAEPLLADVICQSECSSHRMFSPAGAVWSTSRKQIFT